MRYVVNRKPGRGVKTMDIFGEMDRIMNACYQDAARTESRTPRVDIQEHENHYHMEAELPGYTEKEVQLRVEENLLILEARPQEEARTDQAAPEESAAPAPRYLLKERSVAPYKRSFVLPKDVDPAAITASMKNGILSLELAKSEASKPLTIYVKAS